MYVFSVTILDSNRYLCDMLLNKWLEDSPVSVFIKSIEYCWRHSSFTIFSNDENWLHIFGFRCVHGNREGVRERERETETKSPCPSCTGMLYWVIKEMRWGWWGHTHTMSGWWFESWEERPAPNNRNTTTYFNERERDKEGHKDKIIIIISIWSLRIDIRERIIVLGVGGTKPKL